MARIYPFKALRYSPSAVRIEDVVTQPYDKISPAMQQAYYQRSPYNLVRIILGLPELFDNEENNVYSRAARDFASWREQGVLSAESEPAVFAYSQRFTVPGTSTVRERRGFIALGALYDYSQGVVFRHEQTLSKPKSDRLNLLRATRAHFGQIFMLYSDPVNSAEKLLFSGNSAPDMQVLDEYGVTHRVWKVTDPGTINLLVSAMQDKKLIIADGHHRYETALNYSRENAPADAGPSRANTASAGKYTLPPYPEAAVMMTFVNMDSDGLTILPTHRVVHGLRDFDVDAFLKRAQEFFTVTALDGSAEPEQLMQTLGAQTGTAFIAVTAKARHLLVAKAGPVAEALADQSARQRQLDIVQLHSLVLERLLGISAEAVRDQSHLKYLREAGEAIQLVQSGEANIAFLMNPVGLDQLREIAFAGDVMPQKSTDFFPKLLSGLAIYALDNK